jgi:hypothetical protein
MDYQGLMVDIPGARMTAEDLLRVIAQSLPGWQATAFPGHLILYEEHREYIHGQVICEESGRSRSRFRSQADQDSGGKPIRIPAASRSPIPEPSRSVIPV